MIRIVMSYIVAGLLLIDLICFPHFLPLLLANFSLLMILILLNRGLLNRSGWLRCDRLRWEELLQLLRRKVPIEHFVVGLLFRYSDQQRLVVGFFLFDMLQECLFLRWSDASLDFKIYSTVFYEIFKLILKHLLL